MSTFTTGKVVGCFVDTYAEGRARITRSYSMKSVTGAILLRSWRELWQGGIGNSVQFEDDGSLVLLQPSQKGWASISRVLRDAFSGEA